jgi:hypothetical protein
MSSLLDNRVEARRAPTYFGSSGSSPPLGRAQQKPSLFSGVLPNTVQTSTSKLFEAKAVQEKAAKVTAKDLAGPTAISQALLDIAGVYAPKLLVLRSGFQLFEESFLEFVEDLAFYFSAALIGYALHKPMAKLAKLKPGAGLEKGEHASNKIGQGLGGKTTEKNEDGTDKVHKNLIAAKFGTVMAAIAGAAGFEFMIQHTKNVLTAKEFHVKNFTAVAGLEDAQDKSRKGERDPVEKARQRAKQTAAVTAGLIGTALLAPLAVRKSSTVESAARKILGYVDYGKGKSFDLSKVFLGIIAGIGAWSYIDASRDSLERKENATRLAVVIPYMLIGKELMMLALAKGHQRFGAIDLGNEKVKLKQLAKEAGFSFTHSNPIKQALNRETFMDMNVLRNQEQLQEHFKEVKAKWLEKHPEDGTRFEKLDQAIGQDFARRLGAMKTHAFYLSAATTGILINLIAYSMTRLRYRNEQENDPSLSTQSNAASSHSPFNSLK